MGPPCHRVQSKFFKEVELHIVPLWVCCYIVDKKKELRVLMWTRRKEKRKKRLVLFIIILEERDKKTWLAVRRVRMLVGR